MLNAAASMEMLEDNLDSISIHSTRDSHSTSRESLQSSSKYDSAFDSHYSEDTTSLSSQILTHTPCTVERSILPSILTPPLQYRISTVEDREERDASQNRLLTPVSRKKHPVHRYSGNHQQKYRSPSPLPNAAARSKKRLLSIEPFNLQTHDVQPSPPVNLDKNLQPPPDMYHQPDSPPAKPSRESNPVTYEAKIPSPLLANTSASSPEASNVSNVIVETQGSATASKSHDDPQSVPKSQTQAECVHIPTGIDSNIMQSALHRRFSDSSSTDDLVSNDSTPTMNRSHPTQSDSEALNQMPLDPQVTIIYPSDSNFEHSRHSPTPLPRPSPFPKRGTVFYQDSLTPPASPCHTTTHRHTSPSHLLPSRYQDTNHSMRSSATKAPKRRESMLKRLIRKRGSFKEEGTIKRRLPVKRSFSDRIAYHIKKGWIDYEEDLEFISQPSHPRAVGRMIDKKAGKYHVVQLYKPPSGKYGIFISQSSDREGVFVSRFSDDVAAKFYAGLISPGDQIIRVDGKNLDANASVDYVYDLMTKSNSVIFTVIPVCSRPDWC